MKTINSGSVWCWVASTVVVGLGLVGNLGSSQPPPPPECAAGSEKYEAQGDMQTGAASAPLGGGLRVKFSCSIANPPQYSLPAQLVRWSVTSGGGAVNGKTSDAVPTTDTGTSEVHWSLGALQGMQTVTATVADKVFTFKANATLPFVGGDCTAGPATTFEQERHIVGNETWTRVGQPYRASNVSVTGGGALTIEPGVTVCLQGHVFVGLDARLLAEGKPGQEIRLTVADKGRSSWTLFMGSAAQPNAPSSVLRYVWADNLTIMGTTNHSVQVEDSRFVVDPAWRALNDCANVNFSSVDALPSAAASVIRRTLFDGYGSRVTSSLICDAAVRFESQTAPPGGPSVFEARVKNAPGDAVKIIGMSGAPAWILQNCDITQNGRDGIVFDNSTSNVGNNPGATVAGCSITNNIGLGVNNKRSAAWTVNARGNWWGDAAGPGGPKGDGVSAGVDIAAPLTAPPALGY
jgi:hypothetical protein